MDILFKATSDQAYLTDYLAYPLLEWHLSNLPKAKNRRAYVLVDEQNNVPAVEKIASRFGAEVHVAKDVTSFIEHNELDELLTVTGNYLLLDTSHISSLSSPVSFTDEAGNELGYEYIDRKRPKGKETISIAASEYARLWDHEDTFEELDKLFQLMLAPLEAKKNPSLEEIRELLSSNPHPHNEIVLDYVNRYAEKGLSDEVGYGLLTHRYSKSDKGVNELMKQEELSWLHMFLYDSADSKYCLWRYLERRKGAKIVLIEDSESIKEKVPYKRQYITDYFEKIGKRWVMSFDDDFTWRIAYKLAEQSTPSSCRIDFVPAMSIVTWLTVDNDYDYVCVGANMNRLQYQSGEPVVKKRAPMYWSLFTLKIEALNRHGIRFITDQPIHEDIVFSLDIAKNSMSVVPLFLFQEGTYDFNNHLLVSREPATDAYGGTLFRTKTKIQNGVPTKFYSINTRELEKLKLKSLFD